MCKEATNMMCIASCNDFSEDSFWRAVEYRYLLEGAIIKSEQVISATPVGLKACYATDRQIMNDMEERDYWYKTPLHKATVDGDLPLVVELLGAGADPNEKDKWGFSASLHTASKHQRELEHYDSVVAAWSGSKRP
jgi:hypothetical protein